MQVDVVLETKVVLRRPNEQKDKNQKTLIVRAINGAMRPGCLSMQMISKSKHAKQTDIRLKCNYLVTGYTGIAAGLE